MTFTLHKKLTVETIDTWAAVLQDKPGSLAGKLNALAEAGVDLEFVIARRDPDRPGMGVLFVTPIKNATEVHAAHEAGFEITEKLHALRIAGPDRQGQGARIAQTLADKGINLRGLSAAVVDKTFVAYVALDTANDAMLAAQTLKEL